MKCDVVDPAEWITGGQTDVHPDGALVIRGHFFAFYANEIRGVLIQRQI